MSDCVGLCWLLVVLVAAFSSLQGSAAREGMCSTLPTTISPPPHRHLEYKRAGGRSSARFGDTVRRRLWRRRQGTPAADAPALAVPADAEAGATAAAAVAAVGEGVSVEAAAAAVARDAREGEARKKAIKAFLALVLDVLRCGRLGGRVLESTRMERDCIALHCACVHGCCRKLGPLNPDRLLSPRCLSLCSRRQLWTLVPWDPAAPFLLAKKHQKVYQELQVGMVGWVEVGRVGWHWVG